MEKEVDVQAEHITPAQSEEKTRGQFKFPEPKKKVAITTANNYPQFSSHRKSFGGCRVTNIKPTDQSIFARA